MLFDQIKSKLDCCYADQVFNEYLHQRYGINNCKKTDQYNINNLRVLKKTFDYYKASLLTNPVLEINTGNKEIVCGDCNISDLIEKINIL